MLQVVLTNQIVLQLTNNQYPNIILLQRDKHMVQTRSSKRRTRQSNKKTAKIMPTLTKRQLRTPRKSAGKSRCKPLMATRQIRENSSSLNNLNKEDFICPICQEIYIHPFKLNCRHIFCFVCLDNISRSSYMRKTCPCCRAAMGNGYPLKAKEVNDSLIILFRKLDSSQREHYMHRLRQVEEQLQRRNRSVKELRNFQKIGYKMENTWNEGFVFFVDTGLAVLSNDKRKLLGFKANSCNVDHLRNLNFNFTSLRVDRDTFRVIVINSITRVEDIYQPDRNFLMRLSSLRVIRNQKSSLRKPKVSQR